MNSKYAINAAVAAGALSLAVVAPLTYGSQQSASTTDSVKATAENKWEQGESAVKDAWLDGKLETALLFNEHVNSFDIDTEVKNGAVRLTGAVESEIDRDLAGEIAKSIDGITSVRNDLVVDEEKARMSMESADSEHDRSFKRSVLNATLTARVKSKLIVNGSTSAMDINVDSNDGVVTLSGSVDSDEESDLAERIASNTKGAASVNNRLSVADREDAE